MRSPGDWGAVSSSLVTWGREDEDTRGGFAHGGWAQAGNDEVMGRVLGERMAQGGGLLFGRRTYDDVLSFWNSQPDSPFTPALNGTPKYVASRSLEEPLPWPNSTLLKGDAADAVATVKSEQADTSFGIMGSRALIHALMTLADSVTTTTGVIIATYRTTTASR